MDNKSEQLKKIAAEYALRQYINSNMTIGIGTGSTVRYFIDALAQLYQKGALTNITCLSTSEATTKQARALQLPVVPYGDLLANAPLDIAVDGADNVNHRKQLIKGGGGALTREKIIAYNSRLVVIIADESKYAPTFPLNTVLPLEVMEIAHQAVARQLQEMHHRSDGAVSLFSAITVRHSDKAATVPQIFRTDNGNVILDATLAVSIDDAQRLEERLNTIPGVVENGFFTVKAVQVVIATENEVRVL